ncbi:MAG: hypothetical protein Q9214_003611 [Letrouitia sp. 1 TL-2023]
MRNHTGLRKADQLRAIKNEVERFFIVCDEKFDRGRIAGQFAEEIQFPLRTNELDGSVSGSSCDPLYLQAIQWNLETMAYIVAFQWHRAESAKNSSLKAATKYSWIATKCQLHRLANHPELFPDAKTREEFFIKIGHQLHGLSRIVSNHKSSSNSRALLHENAALCYNKSIWPAFDQKRKAWQQWFHLRAPGSGISRQFMNAHNPRSQIVPWAGHFIIGRMGGEAAYLKQEMATSQEVPDRRSDYNTRLMLSVNRQGYKSTLQGYRRLLRGGIAEESPEIRTPVNRKIPNFVTTEEGIDSLRGLSLVFAPAGNTYFLSFEMPINMDQEPSKLYKPLNDDNIGDSRGSIERVKDNIVAVVPKNGKTRPLNSWMAFRSYYSVIFDSMQQKEISGLLTYMWHSEPAKAKWAIAAKAYTTIRDAHGQGNVSLEDFLAVVAPFLGMIAPADYLDAWGWGISVMEGGNAGFHRVREVDRGHEMAACNHSADDVVDYCHGMGFIHAAITRASGPRDRAVLSMATAGQPWVGPAVEVPNRTDDRASVPAETSVTAHDHRHRDPMWPADPCDLGSPTVDGFMKVGHLPVGGATDMAAAGDTGDPVGGDPFDAFNISEWIHPEAFDEEGDVSRLISYSSCL